MGTTTRRRRGWELASAAAVACLAGAPAPAEACSGQALPPTALYPSAAELAPNPPQVLLSVNGFTNLQDVYLILGGPRTPTDPGAIAPATLEVLPMPPFGSLAVLTPDAPLVLNQLYTIAARTSAQEELHVYDQIRIGVDPPPMGPQAPTSLTWFDERLTEPSLDSCRPNWVNALHLTTGGGDPETLWYRVTATLEGGGTAEFATTPLPGGNADGVFHIPANGVATCVEVVAIGVTGLRSDPVRTCQPTKCVERALEFPNPPVDWSMASECNMTCTDCGPDGAGGLEGLAGDEGCGCTSAAHPDGAPAAGGILGLVALGLAARPRRRGN